MINEHLLYPEDDVEWEQAMQAELETKFQMDNRGKENCVLFIDNVPVVSEEKMSKLLIVLKKVFGTLSGAPLPEEECITLPLESDGAHGKRTKGFCFVEFPTTEQAQRALREADGYRLDKAHVFSAVLLDDMEKISSLPSTFTPPVNDDQMEMEHWKWWLRDSRARDQFVLRHADETVVYWNQKQEKPELAYARPQWTETYVQWSPLGTYLATFHRQGIVLWVGSSWRKSVRFAHIGVKSIAFSPKENYLVTFNPEGRDDHLQVWDVRTGKLLSTFAAPKTSTFPQLQWSFDDQWVARLVDNAIEIYTVPSMTLLDDKPLKVDQVKGFSWSPCDPILSFWTPESGNIPARVTLMSMPSRTVLRAKNLFNVNECKMHWQSAGDYLCVVVDRHTKSKKSSFANFEVFQLRERDVPVDVVELKESIHFLAWEPHGDAFVAIGGEMPKSTVYFYQMDKKKGRVALFKTFERKSVNSAAWSPKGQFLILAGLKTMTGLMEFWNAGTSGSPTRDLELLHTTEHYMVTDIEWDPTGRYVTSVVSALHHQMETGYQMHEFHGRPMFRQQLEKFYQFLWRPRPPSLLSSEKQREVRKNLKEVAAEFEMEDAMATSQLSQQLMDERRALATEWRDYVREKRRRFEELRDARRELRNGASSDVEEDTTVVEEIVEEIVDEKIEVVS